MHLPPGHGAGFRRSGGRTGPQPSSPSTRQGIFGTLIHRRCATRRSPTPARAAAVPAKGSPVAWGVLGDRGLMLAGADVDLSRVRTRLVWDGDEATRSVGCGGADPSTVHPRQAMALVDMYAQHRRRPGSRPMRRSACGAAMCLRRTSPRGWWRSGGAATSAGPAFRMTLEHDGEVLQVNQGHGRRPRTAHRGSRSAASATPGSQVRMLCPITSTLPGSCAASCRDRCRLVFAGHHRDPQRSGA